jgi:hypothetical protein
MFDSAVIRIDFDKIDSGQNWKLLPRILQKKILYIKNNTILHSPPLTHENSYATSTLQVQKALKFIT